MDESRSFLKIFDIIAAGECLISRLPIELYLEVYINA